VETRAFYNGKELVRRAHLTQPLETQSSFAHSYHSWERDLNQNNDGLIRQYFPKGSDCSKLTSREVPCVERARFY